MRQQKKILFTSHTANFHKFNRPLMKMLRGKLEGEYSDLNIGGWEVDYASANEEQIFDADNVYEVNFARSPLAIGSHIKAYKQLKRILEKKHYDVIHTHTPVGSVITRLAARKARKNETKVIYTSHGFHFYKGAPLKLWCLFYPIERKCAKYTDLLITINREDYLRSKKFKTKAKMIHGVGVDTTKFNTKISKKERDEVRAELRLKEDDFVIAYAAEFTKNKNHRFILESLKETLLSNPNIKLIFLGKGELLEQMKELSKTLGISAQVHFLGYRNSIVRILQSCDLAVSASIREGLGIGVIEAQLCGLPIIISDNRGHREIFKNNKQVAFSLRDPKGFAEKVEKAYRKECDYHIPFDEVFSLRSSLTDMRKIYLDISK